MLAVTTESSWWCMTSYAAATNVLAAQPHLTYGLSRCLMLPAAALVFALARDPGPLDLTPAEQAVVRRSVYAGEMGIEIGPYGPGPAFTPRLFAPPELGAIYRRRPAAVIDLLTRIVDGGRPRDSMLAFGYIVSLNSSPVVAARLVETFDADAYDQLDKQWGTPPREHWLNAARRELAGTRYRNTPKPNVP